ncbi:xylulokinase [Streptomyces fradiae]|uniref:xylulokinase n=1 Tax=Streptomyces fradiae TaxID=1906 RepID=UPI002943ADFC|nr:xylulokinase [Streptomyces fradiae]WOI60108.1 xylulokinase [Streptomyces fradiae]
MDSLVIGVDSSTQSTKAAVVAAATGRILAVGRAPHTVTGEDGARESDPERWWEALGEAVAAGLGRAGADPRAVSGIAVAGQQHGLVVLDRAGRPLRPALLWNDTRSAPQAAALTARLGARSWLERTGSVPVASMTAAKWRWLREHEPRTADAAAAVRLPHDFLTERLTGTAVTDPGDASGTCWYSTATGAYDPGLLDLLELDAALLPQVAPSGGAPAGGLTTRAASALGLPAGIPVAAGTGDNMAAAVGLGLGAAGLLDHPAVSLGTSGTVFAATRERPANPALAGFAAADGHGTYLPLCCTLNCTLAVDRVAALLGLDREDAAPGGEAVVLPYLDGERTPDLPGASGLMTGLRHTTTRRQLLGAAYEGAVFALLRALGELPGAAGDAPLRLVGGGARGRAWVETVRRLSGRAVVLPRTTELVAVGAAALAAGAAGGGDPVAVAAGWRTGEGETLPPVAPDRATLDRISAVLDRATALLTTQGHR